MSGFGPLSLAGRISIYFGVFFSSILLVFTLSWWHGLPWWGFDGARTLIENEVTGDLSALAERGAGRFANWIDERRVDLNTLAGSALFQKAVVGALAEQGQKGGRSQSALLDQHLEQLRDAAGRTYLAIDLISAADGGAFSSSELVQRGHRPAYHDLLTSAFDAGREEYFVSLPIGKVNPLIYFVRQIPERDADGEVTGKVLALVVAQLNLAEVLLSMKQETFWALGASGRLLVVDDAGKLVAAYSAAGSVEYQTNRPEPVVQRAMTGLEGAMQIERDDRRTAISVIRQLNFGDARWSLIVDRDVDEALQPVRDRLRKRMVMLLVVLILGMVPLVVLARQVSRPIRQLSAAAGQIAQGNLSARPDLAGTPGVELIQLASVFTQMADRIEAWHIDLERAVRQKTRAIEQEKRAAQRYLDIAGVMLVALDTGGRISMINRAGAALLGNDQTSLVGLNWFEHFVPVETQQRSSGAYLQLMEGRLGLHEKFESRLLTSAGDQILVAWHNVLLRSDDGQILGVLASGEDITDRKRAERALRRSEAHLSSLLAATSDWVWELNANGVYVFVGPQVTGLLGYRPEDLLGKTPFDLMPPAEAARVAEFFGDVMASHSPLRDFENVNLHRDGREVVLGTSAVAVFEDDGTFRGYRGLCRDITAKKAAENLWFKLNVELEQVVQQRTGELLLAKERAESADVAKSQFLANMSHEIRTPLNAIIGFSGLALRASVPPDLRDYLSKINSSGEHLLELISNVLDISKITSGHMELNPVSFDFRQRMARLLSVLGHKAAESGLRLECEISEQVPGTLRGDALRLDQVLMNLLSNAIKFSPTGVIRLKVDLDSEEPGQDEKVRLRFSVEDQGIGLSDEEVARIFKPFMQADASTTRLYGGTGLGLAISRQLVELMGGQLSVKSVRGQGSTFMFSIDCQRGDPSELEPQRGARARHYPENDWRFVGVRILVVDDQPMNREIACELLRAKGAETDEAADGKAAINMVVGLPADHYDLVLMDVQMPVMDGLTATRKIRQYPGFEQLPIVALTAHVMEEERQRSVAAGCNDQLGKPYSADELCAVVRDWVAPGKVLAQTTQNPADVSYGDQEASSIAVPVVSGPVQAVALIDWTAVENTYSAVSGMLNRVLLTFDATWSDKPQAFRQAADEGDFAALAFLGHSLKSVAGALKAETVVAASVELDAAASAQRDEAPAMARQLADVIERLLVETRQRAGLVDRQNVA